MLGKKELVVILVVLVCVAVYLYLEYVLNQHKGVVVEGFTMSMDKQRKIDEMKKINQDMFKFYENFLTNEMLFYRHDIKFANYLIQKKFDIKTFLTKPQIVNNERQYIKNPKVVSHLENRKKYLENIVNNIEFALAEIENLKTNHNISNKFYDSFKNILTEVKNIYGEKLSFLLDGNTNFFNYDEIIKNYNTIKDTGKIDDSSVISMINKYIKVSKSKFKMSAENIEKDINDLIYFLDISSDIDKNVRLSIRPLLKTRLNSLAKVVLRDMTFEIIEEIVLAIFSSSIGYSNNVIDEKTDAAKKSNKIISELINLLEIEQSATQKVLEFFKNNKYGMIILTDSEFNYFNAVNTNTNMLQNFCKKIKKVDRPNNSNFLYKRLAKEYIVKKNNQIDKLNNEINQIIGEMTLKEAYNTNLYNYRTSVEAEKQIDAIKEAKKNIDTIGKFNINLK